MTKPPKPVKSETLRRLDAEGIRARMQELDLTSELFPELRTFEKLLEDYVQLGQSASGRVKLPRIHKAINYKLTTRPNLECSAVVQEIARSRLT